MNVVADKSEPLTAVHRPWRNFRFVGIEPLELADHLTVARRWGKMSKHSVRGGDFAGLMQRFGQLQEKARRRTGQSFRIIVVQEAGLDGFWIHRAPRVARLLEPAAQRPEAGAEIVAPRDH